MSIKGGTVNQKYFFFIHTLKTCIYNSQKWYFPSSALILKKPKLKSDIISLLMSETIYSKYKSMISGAMQLQR